MIVVHSTHMWLPTREPREGVGASLFESRWSGVQGRGRSSQPTFLAWRAYSTVRHALPRRQRTRWIHIVAVPSSVIVPTLTIGRNVNDVDTGRSLPLRQSSNQPSSSRASTSARSTYRRLEPSGWRRRTILSLRKARPDRFFGLRAKRCERGRSKAGLRASCAAAAAAVLEPGWPSTCTLSV